MDEKFYDLMEKLYLELQNTKIELKQEIQGLRTELKGEIQGLRTELTGEIQALNQRVSVIEATMATKKDLELLAEEVKHEIQIVHDEVVAFRKDFTLLEMTTAKNSYDIAAFKAAR